MRKTIRTHCWRFINQRRNLKYELKGKDTDKMSAFLIQEGITVSHGWEVLP